MTHKQMRDQVVQWLGLQDITSYDETSIVEQQLYQGTLDLLSRTRCVVRCVELRTVEDEPEYTLDHSILALVDVEDGRRRRLRRGQGYGPAERYGTPDSPIGVYGFTLVRSDVLLITPTPSEDGQLIQVWAVLRPQPMTEDDDDLGDEEFGAIPPEFHDAVVDYALWKCADYADDQTAQNGEYYRVLYEGQDGRGGRLGQVRTLINKRGTARAARANVNLRSVSDSGSYI